MDFLDKKELKIMKKTFIKKNEKIKKLKNSLKTKLSVTNYN